MQSFITQDPRDRDFLVNNLRNYDVPVLNYTGHDSRRELPPEISADVSLGQQFCFSSISIKHFIIVV